MSNVSKQHLDDWEKIFSNPDLQFLSNNVNNNTDNTSEQLFRILDTPLSTSTNSLGDVQASPHSNLATHAVSQTKFHSNLEDWDNLFSNLKISKLVKDAGNDLGHLETSKIIDFLGSTSKQSVDSQSTTDHRPTKKRRTTTCSPAASSGSDGDDTDDAYKPGRSVPPPPRRRRIPCASSKFESISRYDLIFSDPAVWSAPLSEIKTVRPEKWIGGQMINFYLLNVWECIKQNAHTYLVDLNYTTEINVNPTRSVQKHFRLRYDLPLKDPCSLKPVALLVLHSSHYFVVVFDYAEKSAYIMGSRIKKAGYYFKDVTWDSWKGPELWIGLSALFGWRVCAPKEVKLSSRDWKQNTYDCGATAASVAISLATNGPTYDSELRILCPKIRCAHAIRSDMLSTVFNNCYALYHKFLQLTRSGSNTWSFTPEEADTQMLETGLGYISLVGRISASLRNLEKSCQSCKLCGKLPPPLLPPPTKKDDVPSNSDSNTLPNHLKNVKLMQGSRIRTTLPIIDRSKVAPKLPAEQFISLPSNKDFDEYFEGPTIEDHTPNSDAWDSLPTNPYAIPFIRGCWENFKDYGYRLEPSFALMFNNEDPKLVEEHLLPTQSLSPNSPHLNDKRPQMEMSIEDMNSYSSDPWSSDAVKAFVCGKLGPTEEEFVIDPTFDKVPLSIDNITINFDIDSMIWVTHHLKFNQAISVHVLPSYSNLPPIYRNNHVYVNILMPRSDLDKSTHFSDRQEWFSKPFPVSVIPHMHFATLGRGAGSINISVMFPRMIHRNEYSGFRVNKVPFEVQCFWLTGIVLPAIVAVAIAGEEEYVNYNLDEWRWKACHHDAFTNVKTSAIIPSKLDRLQFVMRDIISKNYIDFGMFGSFFFVSDARGIKSLTLGDDPYAALKREYSSMDWEYAMERKNGQLFLDLGISYHPKTHSGEPLVGLWRLDALAESYDAAGMTKGVIHHTTTLSEYGNRQSSMDQYRSHVVQIPFRQSYNLAFEAIRSPGKKNYFCDDKEAYNNTAEFQQCLSKYRTLLTSSEMKSFGVREEIRGSGRAIIEALKHCKNKALKYLESDPILWIRSRVWFRFLSLRLIALNQLQLQLFRLKPPNYGILTSINMHLIRSTLITPICTTGYLQEALYSLHFNAERTTLTQRFGMFFLHTLDYDTGYIPEIEDEDTPETDRVMGLNKKRKAKKSAPLQIAEADIDPDTYPLGLSPAWFEIVKMLEDNPGSLIRPWIASQELPAVSMKAAELFIGMTNDLTRHSLNPAHLKSKLTLQISTIEDAMQFWTVESFQTHFLSCQFKASNFGLRGARTGPAQSSFQDMAIIFFPPLQTVFNPSSVWGPFSRQGYISIYHKELQRRSLEKQDELFQELNAIFRRLQCLPVASACGSGARQHGKLWTTSDGAIEVNTNPRFYRLREIGDPVKAKRRVALRIKYTNKVIESRLIAGYKGIPIQLSRRIAKLQDKAGQAKMKRQPPLNRWQKRKRDDLDDDLNDSDGQGCEDHMEIEKEDNWNDALDDTESDEDRDEDEGRYESWDEDEDEDDVT